MKRRKLKSIFVLHPEEQLPAWREQRGRPAGGSQADEAEGAGDAAFLQGDAGRRHRAQPALAGKAAARLSTQRGPVERQRLSSTPFLWPLQHHMSRGSGTGGGGGHWKESPKKNAMNELQDKLMTVRLREAEAQAELREVKLNALQLESQVRTSSSLLLHPQEELLSAGSHVLFIPFLRQDIHLRVALWFLCFCLKFYIS